MQKKNLLSYIGLSLAVLGTAGFIFLYFYPYQSVNFEILTNQSKDLNSLSLIAKEIETTSEDYETYTSSFSSFLISTNEEYEDLTSKANIVSTKYNSSFFEKKELLALSIKGSFVTYSKLTKFNTSNNNARITIGVEGDHILTKDGSTNDEIFTYYLVPINNQNPIESLTLIFTTI